MSVSTFTNTDANIIYYGTEFKLNVNMEAIDNCHMADADFTCKFFCNKNNVVEIAKADMIQIDEDNYVAALSSEELGKGYVTVKYECDIPDADFGDGLRHEVVEIKTGLKIV